MLLCMQRLINIISYPTTSDFLGRICFILLLCLCISGGFMHRYVKGARSERELLNTFYELGYSVIRSAGSGVNALGPDIIALRDRQAICIECKAWDRGSLSLDPDQFLKLLEWERNTSFPTFVAWRMNGKGWYFVKLGEFKKNEKNYTVTMRKTLEINRRLEAVLGATAGGATSAQGLPVAPVGTLSQA